MFGSVAVTCESGINNLQVRDVYYVDHLSWFECIWFALSNHSVLLVTFVTINIVLLVQVLWHTLCTTSRRRPSLGDE